MSKESWAADIALVQKTYGVQPGDNIPFNGTWGEIRMLVEQGYRRGRTDSANIGVRRVNDLIMPAIENLVHLLDLIPMINLIARHCSGEALQAELKNARLDDELAKRITKFLGHSRDLEADPYSVEIASVAPRYLVVIQRIINGDLSAQSALRDLAREYSDGYLKESIEKYIEQLQSTGHPGGMGEARRYIAKEILALTEANQGMSYTRAAIRLKTSLADTHETDMLLNEVWDLLNKTKNLTNYVRQLIGQYKKEQEQNSR